MTVTGLGDGRAARAVRTRDAVLDALLALHAEGDLAPPVRRVAARAGVGLRTVYGHFTDLETLYAVAGERQRDRQAHQARGQDSAAPDQPLETRIELFCAARANLLEALLPVIRASRLREPFSAQLATNRARHVASAMTEINRVFAAELAAAGPGGPDLREALFAATSSAAWESLRADRALSPDTAGRVLRRTVTALLTAKGP